MNINYIIENFDLPMWLAVQDTWPAITDKTTMTLLPENAPPLDQQEDPAVYFQPEQPNKIVLEFTRIGDGLGNTIRCAYLDKTDTLYIKEPRPTSERWAGEEA